LIFPTLTQLFLNPQLLLAHFLRVRKLAELQVLRESLRRSWQAWMGQELLQELQEESLVFLRQEHFVEKQPFHRSLLQASRQLAEATVHQADLKN
jgi:hypothetical protein